MANVNCTVYFREHGTSKIYAVEQARGRVGCYGIRWYEGTRQRQKIIGQYSAAVAAKLKKELELKKARQNATSILRPDKTMKLDTAIEVFIREREDLNADSARRWRLELDLFKEQSGKVHLYELTRDDVFAYRKWYKDHALGRVGHLCHLADGEFDSKEGYQFKHTSLANKRRIACIHAPMARILTFGGKPAVTATLLEILRPSAVDVNRRLRFLRERVCR